MTQINNNRIYVGFTPAAFEEVEQLVKERNQSTRGGQSDIAAESALASIKRARALFDEHRSR